MDQSITDWLKEYLSPFFKARGLAVDINTSFDSLGLDSVTRVEMIGALEEAFGLDLDPILGFEYPTIKSLKQQIIAQEVTHA